MSVTEHSRMFANGHGVGKTSALHPNTSDAEPLMSSSPGKPLMPVTVVDISLSEKEDAMKQSTRMVFIMPAVTLLIGWGISLLIYHFTGAKASYDAKIETLASNDLHWLYFSALVLSRLNMVINFLPMVYKSAARATGRLS